MKKFYIYRLVLSTGLYYVTEKRLIAEVNTFSKAIEKYRELKRANKYHTYKIECIEG